MQLSTLAVKTFSVVGFVLGISQMSIANPGQTPARDSLLDVVKEALDTNPELQFKMDSYDVAVHERREAFGGYLPSIDLAASAGRADREYDGRGSYTRNYAEISLTQMLFDGFLVRNRLARADHTVLARYYELMEEAELKALEVAQAYVDVMRHRELVELAKINIANHQRVQAHIEERAESGVGNRADLQQITGRLSLAQSNLLTEIANLQTVTARFQRLVGRTPAHQLEPLVIPQNAVPAELELVLNSAFENNPALYAAFEEINAASAGVGEAKSSRYPTLELGLRQGLYKNNNIFDNRFDNTSYGNEGIIELRARYNLYRGGSDRAAERAAYSRLNQAQSLRDKACVDLRQTSTIAWNDVINLQEKLNALRIHRDESAGVVIAYRDQFDIGRRSLLDVLDSENESFQAERAFTAGEYDLMVAKLQTLNGMGALMQTLGAPDQSVDSLSTISSEYVSPINSEYCTDQPNVDWEIEQYMLPDFNEHSEKQANKPFEIGLLKTDDVKPRADYPGQTRHSSETDYQIDESSSRHRFQ